MVSSTFSQFILLISLLLINPLRSESSDVVHVSVYYQSVRPHDKNLPVALFHALRILYFTDIMDVVQLSFVPYGIAVTHGNATVTCPDGPTQCFYNTIEACAVDVLSFTDSFVFVGCCETQTQFGKTQPRIWRSCVKKLDLDPTPIENCYKSGRGNYLLILNGRETKLINPPQLPYIVVNGNPVPNLDNIVSGVCKAYSGPIKFKACQPTVGITSTEKLISSSNMFF